MESGKKQKFLSRLSAAFVKFKFNFQYFEKCDEPHSAFFPEIIDHERRPYLNV